MADYTSQYTGDQIEAILTSVALKVAKADIATELSDDDTAPAAVSLVNAISIALGELNESLGVDYVKIEGTQTINGAKSFASAITAREGINISANKFITLAAVAPTSDLHAVNRGYVKAHGLDENSAGAAIKSFTTVAGFIGFEFDPNELTALPASTAWVLVGKSTVDNKPYTVTPAQINASVYTDARWTSLNSDYTTFKNNYASDTSASNAAISARLLISTYNTDQSVVNTAINNRVLNSTYATDISAINTSISARLLTATYNVDQTAVNAAINARVLQSAYDTRQTAIDTSLASKMDYAVTGTATAAASATVALATVPKSDVAYFIVSAIFAGTPKPAVFRVAMTFDGTTAYVVSDVLFAGTLTFTATVSGANMVLNIVNGSSTVAVTAKYKTLVHY